MASDNSNGGGWAWLQRYIAGILAILALVAMITSWSEAWSDLEHCVRDNQRRIDGLYIDGEKRDAWQNAMEDSVDAIDRKVDRVLFEMGVDPKSVERRDP